MLRRGTETREEAVKIAEEVVVDKGFVREGVEEVSYHVEGADNTVVVVSEDGRRKNVGKVKWKRVNEEEIDDEGLNRLKEALPSGSTTASYDKACAEMVDSDDDFDCDEEVDNDSNRGVDLVSDEEVVMRDGVKISEKDDVKECLGQLADMFETVKTKLYALSLEDKENRPRYGISELFTFFSFASRGLCI